VIDEIRGFTLHRPWDVTFVTMGKNIENRRWKPPAKLVGALIALHAGQHFNKPDADWIARHFGRVITPAESVAGRIVAVGRLTGFVTTSNSPWFFGPYGWTFANLRAIEPVECRGAQGLWKLSPAVAACTLLRYWSALHGASNKLGPGRFAP